MKPLILLPFLLFSTLVQAQLVFDQAKVRAMPGHQANTAAFLQVTNDSEKTIKLVSVSTSAAKKAEFHSHSKGDKGMMRMQQEPFIEIAAKQTFTFKSGGYHIMVMGLHKPLVPGQTIDMTLEDATGKRYELSVPVVSIMMEHHQKQTKQEHHHHH